MYLRTKVIASLTLLAAAFMSSQAAVAQGAAAAGDAKRGHDLSYTCNGCHAITNYKNVYPTYSVPKLHNQRPEYLVAALKAYKSGDRSHGTMHSQAVTMSEKDMADIAAYLAGPSVITESKNDPAAKDAPKAAATCVACHGTNGVGITADFPTLAGQHADYIERALLDYQKGGRKNAVMGGIVATLTREDIEALANYYSTRTPALETVPKRNFFFSAK